MTALLRDAVLLQQSAFPDLTITASLPKEALPLDIDPTLVSQAIVNLIKNAGEAIESLTERGAPEGFRGEIRVTATVAEDHVEIAIADNGIGLPDDVSRLFEPYVTTRDKGTGLGLPIVRKIIEEHDGAMRLEAAEPFADGAHSGAKAVIVLPLGPSSRVAA